MAANLGATLGAALGGVLSGDLGAELVGLLAGGLELCAGLTTLLGGVLAPSGALGLGGALVATPGTALAAMLTFGCTGPLTRVESASPTPHTSRNGVLLPCASASW